MPTRKKKHVALTIAFFLFGFLISTQIQTQSNLNTELSLQNTSDLVIMVNNLSEKRKALTEEIFTATQTIASYLDEYDDTSELLDLLSTEKNRFDKILGISAVEGPGVSVEIDREMYLLYKDILDIINELWAAGAESIAINDIRLTDRSYLYYTEVTSMGTYITLNDQILQYPLTITAIGDSTTLEQGLKIPGGVINNLNLFRIYPRITQLDSITIPPADTSDFNYQYTKVKSP